MIDKINLLPDVKQQRQREHQRRRLVTTIAVSVMAVAVGVPLILLTIKGAQALTLSRTQNQIDERKAQLANTENITTMLTVKDHLASLPSLYDQRTTWSRFLRVLPSVLPRSIRLTDIDLTNSGSVTFRGAASTYNEVEKFYKSLLNHGQKINPNRVDQNPNTSGTFTSVTVSEIGGPSGTEVTFAISANFSTNLLRGTGQ